MERILMPMERTKLHQFMDAHGITDTALAKESGVSIRHVKYIKHAEREPTRPFMVAILDACRRLSGCKALPITDLFNFEKKAKAA
jgi:hypothetical protein